MNQQSLKYQLLADLIATLEREEFSIGVGKHLELQQLLAMIPESVEVEDMKTLLAPIFAKNKHDQEFFYELFDQSFERVKAKTWEPSNVSTVDVFPKKNKWEIITQLLGGLLLLIASILIFIRISGDDPLILPTPCQQFLEVEPDSIYQIDLLNDEAKKDEQRERLINNHPLEFVSFLNGETIGEIPELGNFQIDSLGNFSIKTNNKFTKSDTSYSITAIAKYKLGTDTTHFNISPKKVISETSSTNETKEPEQTGLVLREHPYPKVLPFVEQPSLWYLFYNKHKYWVKPLLIFLLFALFGAFFNWREEKQHRIIADIQSKNNPPLLWNIQIPNISRISLNEDYFKVLQLMRQRTNDDHFVLSIPKTIEKTIEKGGIIDFQYQYKTRPPEYLLLIDRQSSKNHRAYLYNYLFEAFKANEVYIERFYYEGDIRLCWNEHFPNGIKLHDLQQTFRDARLIIVGSGYQLLNPVSGKLAKWTRVFDNWTNKAILTPRPTKSWASRESQLKEKFILLPASVPSLTTMVDKMEAIDPDEIKVNIGDEVNEPIEFRGNLIDTLKYYFAEKKDGQIDESLVHWIAGCAIYPSLHWDLTMYLGQELSTEQNNLLSFDKIQQLTRLPWFIEGKIPEQARLELLEYLPEEIELKLRKSLRDLFDSIPPPDENSVAYADARINISLNKYLLEKRNLDKEEVTSYAMAGADIDITMLKYLEGEKSPKDFEVDPNLRKYAEGKKPKIEMDLWSRIMAFVLVFLTIGIILYQPTYQKCNGELVQIKELELCLSNPDHYLSYRAAQIRNQINHNSFELIDSLEQEALKKYFLFNSGKRTVTEVGQVQAAGYSVNSILPFVNRDSSIVHFYQNLAVDYYNQGVPAYNNFKDSGETLEKYYELSGDSIQFCEMFDLVITQEKKVDQSQIGGLLKKIIKENCNETTPQPDPENIKRKYITGMVTSSGPVSRVKVQGLGASTYTDGSGKFSIEVPKEIGEANVEISFSHENYQDTIITISRPRLLRTLENRSTIKFNIKLKPFVTTNSCFENLITEYRRLLRGRNFSEARKTLKEIQKCRELTDSQKKTIGEEFRIVDSMLSTNRNNQSIKDSITLTIEVRNQITNNFQKGYEIKIDGIDPAAIKSRGSGVQHKVEVVKGQKYTISALFKGIVKAQESVLAISKDGSNKLKVVIRVGIPALSISDLPEMEMVYLKGGSFKMGIPKNNNYREQQPEHEVEVLPFYMGKYEVTQRVWETIMGSNPSKNQCAKCPVEQVSWSEIQRFIKLLNEKTGQNYRLAYEAEWEYAAKAGRNFKYSGGNRIDKWGWYNLNSKDSSQPFGQLSPNSFGLYDMTGNVMEWVQDSAYPNYLGAPKDTYRPWENLKSREKVARGGSFYHDKNECRNTSRFFYGISKKSSWLGFRLAKSVTF